VEETLRDGGGGGETVNSQVSFEIVEQVILGDQVGNYANTTSRKRASMSIEDYSKASNCSFCPIRSVLVRLYGRLVKKKLDSRPTLNSNRDLVRHTDQEAWTH